MKLLYARAALLLLPQLRPRGAPRRRGVDLRRARARAGRRRRRRARARDVHGSGAGEFQTRRDRGVSGGAGLHAHSRAHRRPPSRSSRTGSPSRPTNRARIVEALEAALKVGGGRVTVRARRRRRHGVQVLGAPALRAVRHRLRRLHPEHVLVQLARRRLRAMPRLRPHHRHRLSARDSRRGQDARGRRDQAVADEEQQGVPRRSHALREAARHPPRRSVARAFRRAARLGHRRRRLVAAAQVVRRRAVLRMARVEGLQDARARAAVEVPQLRRVPGVRRRAAEADVALLAARLAGRCRSGRRARAAFPRAPAGARRRGVRGAARPFDP